MAGKRARRSDARECEEGDAAGGVGCGLSSVLACNAGEYDSLESDGEENEEQVEEEDKEEEEDKDGNDEGEEAFRNARGREGDAMQEEEEEEGEVRGGRGAAQEGVGEGEGSRGPAQWKKKIKPMRRFVRKPDGSKALSSEYLKMVQALREMEAMGETSERMIKLVQCMVPGLQVCSRSEAALGLENTFRCAKGRMQRVLARELGKGTKVSISTEILFVPCCIWVKTRYLEKNPRAYHPLYRTGQELPECCCNDRNVFFAITAHWLESGSWARRTVVLDYGDMYCRARPDNLLYHMEETVKEWGLEGSVVALVTDETEESHRFSRQWLRAAATADCGNSRPSAEHEEASSVGGSDDLEEVEDNYDDDDDDGSDDDDDDEDDDEWNDDDMDGKVKNTEEYRKHLAWKRVQRNARRAARAETRAAAATAVARRRRPMPVTAAAAAGAAAAATVAEAAAAEADGRLASDIPRVRHVLCYARAVIHAVRTLLEIDEFFSLIQKMCTLAVVLEGSGPLNKLHRSAFRQLLCETLGTDARVKDVITLAAAVTAKDLRWDGAYEFLSQAMKLRPAVNKWAARLRSRNLRTKVQVSAREWEVASHIHRCLQPFVAFNRWLGIKPLDEWEWDQGSASVCGDYPRLHSFIPYFGLLMEQVRTLVSSMRDEVKPNEKGNAQDEEMKSLEERSAQRAQRPAAAGPSDAAAAPAAGASAGEEAGAAMSKQADEAVAAAIPADVANQAAEGSAPASGMKRLKGNGGGNSSNRTAGLANAAATAATKWAKAAVLSRLEAAAAVLEQQWQWRDELALMAVVLDPRFRFAFFETPAGKAVMPAEKIRDNFSALVLRYAEGGDGNTEEKIRAEIRTYASEERLGKDADVLGYWRSNGARLPLLAQVAREYLAVPAATIRSGRVGSYTDRRFDEVRNVGELEDELEVEITRQSECLRSWMQHPECADL